MSEQPELSKNQLFHLLKTKPATWNQIRSAFPKFVPNLSKANLMECKLSMIHLGHANLIRASLNGADLSKAQLAHANLINANLSSADLSGATLSEANLNGANLQKANLKQAKLSGAGLNEANLSKSNMIRADLKGCDLSKANLSDAEMIRADLSGADLSGANLKNANLINANLEGANLSGANLSGASLNEARLNGAKLKGANLQWAGLTWAAASKADFSKADLTKADLNGTDLSESNLNYANLSGAEMSQADLTKATLAGTHLIGSNLNQAHLAETKFDETVFGNTNLQGAEEMDQSIFWGPCIIDYRTIQRSAPIPREFLQGCGLPNTTLDMMAQVKQNYYSCYLCYSRYSGTDQEFAEKLHRDLQKLGILCWFAPYDKRDGTKPQAIHAQAIRTYERSLVVLSDYSINSQWVKSEVITGAKNKLREQVRTMIPISLVKQEELEEWVCEIGEANTDLAPELRKETIPQFCNWKSDSDYKKTLGVLLQCLAIPSPEENQ